MAVDLNDPRLDLSIEKRWDINWRDLNVPTAYGWWLRNRVWYESELLPAWHKAAFNGAEASEEGISHMTFRVIEEYARWKTPRKALTTTDAGWPLPNPNPAPPQPVPLVVPWHRAGLTFANDAGQIQKLRGVTAFDAFRLFTLGRLDELKYFADWTRNLGADTWRVFTMWQITGFRSTEQRRGLLPYFTAWCEGQGIRPWLVAFCDQTSQYPDIQLGRDEQDAHWQAVTACANPKSLIECVNEFWQNGGGELSSRYDIGGKLACRSAVPDGSGDPRESGSLGLFTNDHTPRDGEYSRKFKVLLETARLGGGPENAPWSGTGLPAVGGEPPQLQTMTPEGAADLFAGYELYGQGGVIHDGHKLGEETGLQFCKVLTDDNELKCIEAIRQSWNVVPAHLASVGQYSRDGVDENGHRTFPIVRCDSSLRTYGMIEGDTAVVLCPGGQLENGGFEPVNGWRLVDRRGYQGRVLFMAR